MPLFFQLIAGQILDKAFVWTIWRRPALDYQGWAIRADAFELSRLWNSLDQRIVTLCLACTTSAISPVCGAHGLTRCSILQGMEPVELVCGLPRLGTS